MTTLALLASIFPALAAGDGWTGTQLPPTEISSPTPISTPPAPRVDLSQAVRMERLSDEELEWLKPDRKKLPPNPYAQTDYTAYTLEWGEVEMGLAHVSAGIAPRTQLGTVPMLDLLGIYNVSGKVDAIRIGPFDLAVTANHHRLPLGGFLGYQTGFGGTASLRITDRWSVHGGVHRAVLSADGLPDLSAVPGTVSALWGGDVWQVDLEQMGADHDLHLRATTLTTRVATDLRVNRRDTVILQAQAMLSGSLETGDVSEVPPIFGLQEALSSNGGPIPLGDAYVASVAYNAAWRQLEVRVGAGIASVPTAWLLQSTEISWHFGGKTRADERRLRRGWRHNRKVLKSEA